MTEKKKETSFESAYDRLEEILNEMNEKHPSLDDALSLYEEASHLIKTCENHLERAEKKISTLVKDRKGQIVLDETGSPELEAFTPSNDGLYNRT